jgi:hypothetical protein
VLGARIGVGGGDQCGCGRGDGGVRVGEDAEG